jgi:hypothetical protein
MYDTVREFADTYNLDKGKEIQVKIKYASTMSWVCIGVIAFCGIVIIPLLGKIQERIFQLMKIFF